MGGRNRGSAIGSLLFVAVAIFFSGEFLLFSRTAEGRLYLARHGVVFSKAEVRSALSNTLRATFRRLGVGASAQEVEVQEGERDAVVAWSARLPARASLLQANLALLEAVERRGGRVFDAWEETDEKDGAAVRLQIGVGRLLTHEVRLVRGVEKEGDEPVLLAIVLEGFGKEDSDSLALQALHEGFEFSGAVLTNGKNPRHWAEELHKASREVVALVPMEPMNYPSRSPGKDAVLVEMSHNQIRRMVKRNIDRAPELVAYLPHMGGMALRDPRLMEAVCEELQHHVVAYLEPPDVPESKGLDAAARTRVPFLRLDQRQFTPSKTSGWEKELARRLSDLTDTARRRGFAAASLPLDAPTLRVLAREAPLWEKQGVRLVPLSALLRPATEP